MMMIMGRQNLHSNPTVQVPPWDSLLEDPMANIPSSPFSGNALFDDFTGLRCYLPSNVEMAEFDDLEEEEEDDDDDGDVPVDAYSCDEFRMYQFKVRRCVRGRSHDWTECPFAHPGEKARRRDPRKVHYSGNPCPEFRKGQCKKGDSCEFAHGVFECWLHPSRYRTQPCKDGVQCRRRICFFAHTADQLRELCPGHQVTTRSSHPESYDGSPSRLAMDSFLAKGSFVSSPTSILYSPPCSPPSESPPMSPVASLGLNSVRELTSSVRSLQIGKAARMSMNPMNGSGFCSPRSPSILRPTFNSLPSTPTRNPRLKVFDLWDQGSTAEEEPVMERVESGKELRAKIYAKLSRENSLTTRDDSSGSNPDVGWVSELVK